MPHINARRWTRRITAQFLTLGLAVFGLAAVGGQESSSLPPVEPTAVSTDQIDVTPPPMGWAPWNTGRPVPHSQNDSTSLRPVTAEAASLAAAIGPERESRTLTGPAVRWGRHLRV